jgi:asparagine synthase (glutamine-hydrolysing)
MVDILRHRGPDAKGMHTAGPVVLGHTRLSILDLSTAGNQPMPNEDKSLWLVCNGEIYNYKETSQDLKKRGHVFRSATDVEVILHLYEEYGLNLFDHLNGMFAFALWDSRQSTLICAVDRFGKKPLYYALHNGQFAFASEMKALMHVDWVSKEVDPCAIDRYLSLRYIPAPYTIFRAIRKMEPATCMAYRNGSISQHVYWKPRALTGSTTVAGTKTCEEEFESLVTDAVRIRLQSDVPLGVYLSGGVDSAVVAGVMRRLTDAQKVSYTVSFDYEHDEHDRASRLAQFLHFEYNPVTVQSGDFDLLPKIVYHLDEPFGDLLSIPAYLLAKKAKEKLTVILTGDGGDEICNGYLHQKIMYLRYRYGGWLRSPACARSVSRLLAGTPAAVLNMLFDYPDRMGSEEKKKLVYAAGNSHALGGFYEGLTSCFTQQDKRGLYQPSLSEALSSVEALDRVYEGDLQRWGEFPFLSRLSLLDLKYWIPFSVVYRLDKMNMAHAVETRSPFLDYRLVECALNLPPAAKLDLFENKKVIRRMIEKLYPPELREKGKQAFYMPLIDEYRKAFFSLATKYLDPAIIRKRGFLNPAYVQGLLDRFDQRSMLINRQLVSLIVLEIWFQVFVDKNIETVGIYE